MPTSPNIGHTLRTIRTTRKLSLDKTAMLTGVSKAMLGQIERNESSPTIATVWKLATGLDISFSTLLADTRSPSGASQVRDPQMKVHTVFAYSQETRIEVFDIEITEFHEQVAQAHRCGVVEHIQVKKGLLGLFIKDQWQTIKVGESLKFTADQSHGYKDLAGHTVFSDIIYYPNNIDTV